MSAIPLIQPVATKVQPQFNQMVVVKLHYNTYALDLYADRLTTQGYSVINALDYSTALDAAHRYRPAIIVVHDDPSANIDAVHWLELQHTDPIASLALTPLIILADAERAAVLRVQELPDRVILLRNRADTLNQLTKTVLRLIRVWGLDSTRPWPV